MLETSLLAVAKNSEHTIDLYLSDGRNLCGVVYDYNADMLIFQTNEYYSWIYRKDIVSVLGDKDFFGEVESYRRQLFEEELKDSQPKFGDDASAYLPKDLPTIPPCPPGFHEPVGD